MITGQRMRLIALLLLAVGLSVVGVTGIAAAQDEPWSFVATPQIWAAHIAKNGLGGASSVGGLFVVNPETLRAFGDPLLVDKSDPVDALNPQWGLQIAAQKGRWTLAGSFQYVNFETRNNVVFDPAAQARFGVDSLCAVRPSFFPNPTVLALDCIPPGGRFAQEFLNTTRIDMDFSASYFFPDLVPNWFDFSIGGGVKVIYATTTRQFNNLSATAVDQVASLSAAGKGNGLYDVCAKDDCSDAAFKDRVKTSEWIYGVTIPMSATFHLTPDARWLLPLNVSPFIGADTRNDRNVVYQLDNNTHFFDVNTGTPVPPFKAVRLDGTTFAYGVTADATVRYLLNETVSMYTGMRVQYIKGHETYLAYGPLFGLSVRFGGK